MKKIRIRTKEERIDMPVVCFSYFILIWYVDLILDILEVDGPSVIMAAPFWFAGLVPVYFVSKRIIQIRDRRMQRKRCTKNQPGEGQIIYCGATTEKNLLLGNHKEKVYEIRVQAGEAEDGQIIRAYYSWPVYELLESEKVKVYPDKEGNYTVIDGFRLKGWKDIKELLTSSEETEFTAAVVKEVLMIFITLIEMGMLTLIFLTRF